jgi:5-methylcytosine-specific restriction endonuclease McrA
MESPRTKIIDGLPWHYHRIHGWLPGRSKKHKTRPKAKSYNLRLWRAFDQRCGICGLPIVKESQITQDHVVSKAKGGSNERNSVPAHGPCNQRKANRDPTGCELIALMVVNLNLYHEIE